MNRLQMMHNAQDLAKEALARDGHLTINEGHKLAIAFLELLGQANEMTATIVELEKRLADH